MTIAIKICGLSDEASVRAVIKAEADYAGFVHYPKSPRHVSVVKADELKSLLPDNIKSVMVVVNPDDKLLSEIAEVMQPDCLQLHGDESPERIAEIRKKFPALGIIKAISVRNADDIKIAEKFYGVADFLMFDAKPTSSDMMHGGNGIAFDWNIMAEKQIKSPWFLSGGLNPDNVAQAIKISGAKMVDVSSGVERAPGVKDADLIENFVKVVRACN
jgi:phosphoribosylanthranilate isomerase